MIVAWLACAVSEDSAAPALPTYRVVGVRPEDGETGVVEAITPELRLSAPVDLATCPPDGARLDAVDPDGQVLFPVPVVLADAEGGEKLRLTPDGAVPRGWTYAVTARAGEGGCRSVDGAILEPFRSTFTVP